jgi:hypothetical protein
MINARGQVFNVIYNEIGFKRKKAYGRRGGSNSKKIS